ncbi:MAG: hypothetical protein WD009_01340 [Phycisphaeraceae bacterium]
MIDRTRHARWLILLAALVAGCGGPRAYDVEVTLDESLASTSIAVDIIGANASLAETLSEVSVNEYFSPGNRLRAGVDRKTLRFVGDSEETQTLERDDPIWDTWMDKGATQLIVVANLLGSFDDRTGSADDRRLILPLASDRWRGREIRITVREGFLDLTSRMREGD